ncbi:MAG: hypothetical protein OXH47_10185 [Paracoccaceae bacterium]|nr:hypothetical protein [Paracoccaceae bacterium]
MKLLLLVTALALGLGVSGAVAEWESIGFTNLDKIILENGNVLTSEKIEGAEGVTHTQLLIYYKKRLYSCGIMIDSRNKTIVSNWRDFDKICLPFY